MAYTLPTFNLVCQIYTISAPPPAAPRLTSVCNLALGRRSVLGYAARNALVMQLLLPPLTDIRGPVQGGSVPDLVVVPTGSGRLYIVENVDDIGKGFSNEHRIALIRAVAFGGLVWPTPIP
jgi:hypothetical protein